MNLLDYTRTIKKLCMDGDGTSFENIKLITRLEYELERSRLLELPDIDADGCGVGENE